VLAAWLKVNAGYRMATEEDCSCQEDIATLREGGGAWEPAPTYHPYYATGDFNADSNIDFAVIVIGSSREHVLLVFNGPYYPGAKPALMAPAPAAGALFFGPPRPKPYRLVVGAFAAEGAMLLPKGATYVLDAADEG
jgi:hypothetical protein